MNRTRIITVKVRSVSAGIIATALVLICTPARAEFVELANNVLDTDTGLEWRKFGSLASQGAYNDALGKYDAGSTYRLPTAAEVDNLLGKLFPGFVANDATGRCALGPNADQLAQAEAFQNQFGGSSSTPYHAMYQDAAGQLRALYVEISPYSAYGSKICLTGRASSYEQYRAVEPGYPTLDLLVMVVRDAIDVKVPVITLYNYVHPRDAGLREADFCFESDPINCEDTSGGDSLWQSYFYDTYYGGDWTQYALRSNPADFAAGKSAPWVRLRSIDFTPVANTGGACTSPMDTNLGNGFCRRSFVGNYYPWHLTATDAEIPGSYIYNQFIRTRVSVDNVVVEQIWENMTIDFAPTTPDNSIRPKSPGWSVYVTIKNTSFVAGDDYNFNPAWVDPASLKLGVNQAPALDYQTYDIDGDGDEDYTYRFNTGATGVTCLDTRITLVGKTSWGKPVAGQDTVVPVGCTETVLMDVDPSNATNTIRPNDNYNVTVAILGMRKSSGDAVDLYPGLTSYKDGVNRSSLKFGPAETPIIGAPLLTDVDGDANQDMLVNFNVFNAGIACGDTQVQLKGNKNSGIPIAAFNNIVTTDCDTGGCHP